MKKQKNLEIKDLKYNDNFVIYLNGEYCCRFKACFSYISIKNEELIVEYTKAPSKLTMLKIKLMKIIYDIDVTLTIGNREYLRRDSYL